MKNIHKKKRNFFFFFSGGGGGGGGIQNLGGKFPPPPPLKALKKNTERNADTLRNTRLACYGLLRISV